MVVCPKCGAKNEEEAKYCTQCGVNLETGAYPSRRYERRWVEEECFGIPRAGTIIVLAIGVIILLAGLIGLLRQIVPGFPIKDVWPLAIIIFGVLVLIGAYYGYRHKY